MAEDRSCLNCANFRPGSETLSTTDRCGLAPECNAQWTLYNYCGIERRKYWRRQPGLLKRFFKLLLGT